ncbi:hypothetical protein GEMRC1_007178 [Eukaryota sp. GEM-RC1]
MSTSFNSDSRLKREYDDLQRTASFEISQLKEELDRSTSENKTLLRQLEQSQSSNVQSLEAEILRLKNKVNKLHSGWTSSSRKSKTDIEQLSAQLAQSRSRCSKLQKTLSEVQDSQSELEEEKNLLQSQNYDLKARERNLVDSRDSMKSKLKDQRNLEDHLRNDISSQDEQIQDLLSTLENCKVNLEGIEGLSLELEEARVLIKQRDDRITSLESQLEALKCEYDETSHDHSNSKQLIDELTVRNEKAQEELRNCESELEQVKTSLEQLKSSREELEEVNSGLLNEMSGVCQENEELHEKISEVLSSTQNKQQNFEQQNNLILCENRQLKQENAQLKSIMEKFENLPTLVQEKDKQVLDLTQKLESQLNFSKNVESSLSSNEEVIQKLEEQNSDLLARFNATRKALLSKETELEALTSVQTRVLSRIEEQLISKLTSAPEEINQELIVDSNSSDVSIQTQAPDDPASPSADLLVLQDVVAHLKSKLISLSQEKAQLESLNRVLENQGNVACKFLLEIWDVDANRYLDLENQLIVAKENGKKLKSRLNSLEEQRQRKVEELEAQISKISSTISGFMAADDFEADFDALINETMLSSPHRQRKTLDIADLNSEQISKISAELSAANSKIQLLLCENSDLIDDNSQLQSRVNDLTNQLNLIEESRQSQSESYLQDQSSFSHQLIMANKTIELLQEKLNNCHAEKDELKDTLLSKITEATTVLSDISNGNRDSLSSVVTILSKFEQKLDIARRGLSKEFSPSMTKALSYELRAQSEALSSVLSDTLLVLENTRKSSSEEVDFVRKDLEVVLKDYSNLPAHLPKVKEYRKKLKDLRRQKILKSSNKNSV